MRERKGEKKLGKKKTFRREIKKTIDTREENVCN